MRDIRVRITMKAKTVIWTVLGPKMEGAGYIYKKILPGFIYSEIILRLRALVHF